MKSPGRMVVALGGNAILRKGQAGTIDQQMENIERSLDGIVEVLRAGWELVLTHGNGPQVGQMLLMVEAARGQVPDLPLGVCVADTEGTIGYLMQQSLQNRLRAEHLGRAVVTLVTQVVVDPGDPAFRLPTKPVGPFLTPEEADRFRKERGWSVADDAGRGWRRVVPSPYPQSLVEADVVAQLARLGVVVIAAGGGGVPVARAADGRLHGVDAVVDKDLAAALLARSLFASRLVMLTGEPYVYLDYRGPGRRPIEEMSVAQAEDWFAAGEFPAGSMGPKIEAAIDYLERGGKEVLITSIDAFGDALAGRAGTRIAP